MSDPNPSTRGGVTKDTFHQKDYVRDIEDEKKKSVALKATTSFKGRNKKKEEESIEEENSLKR